MISRHVVTAEDARAYQQERRHHIADEIREKIKSNIEYGKKYAIIREAIFLACDDGRSETMINVKGFESNLKNEIKLDLERIGFECKWIVGGDLDGVKLIISW